MIQVCVVLTFGYIFSLYARDSEIEYQVTYVTNKQRKNDSGDVACCHLLLMEGVAAELEWAQQSAFVSGVCIEA